MSDKAAAEARAKAIEALEYEREGYVNRGLKDRVEQVNAAIRALKGEPQGRAVPGRRVT